MFLVLMHPENSFSVTGVSDLQTYYKKVGSVLISSSRTTDPTQRRSDDSKSMPLCEDSELHQYSSVPGSALLPSQLIYPGSQSPRE